jgi:hypothetical protein
MRGIEHKTDLVLKRLLWTCYKTEAKSKLPPTRPAILTVSSPNTPQRHQHILNRGQFNIVSASSLSGAPASRSKVELMTKVAAAVCTHIDGIVNSTRSRHTSSS